MAVFDDERLDQGAPTGFRKPPLPLQPVPRKVVDACGLPSPDSVARYPDLRIPCCCFFLSF